MPRHAAAQSPQPFDAQDVPVMRGQGWSVRNGLPVGQGRMARRGKSNEGWHGLVSLFRENKKAR